MTHALPELPLGAATVRVWGDSTCWVVALNRPAKRNALNAMMRDELWTALDAARLAGVGVVLRGLGNGFCAGGDLTEFGSCADTALAHEIRQRRSVARLVASMSTSMVAAIHGPCVGAGLEIAAFAGTILVDHTARLSLPEARYGLVPGAGGTVSVPRRIGRQATLQLVLSGRVVEPAEAVLLGLVDACVPAEILQQRAYSIAASRRPSARPVG